VCRIDCREGLGTPSSSKNVLTIQGRRYRRVRTPREKKAKAKRDFSASLTHAGVNAADDKLGKGTSWRERRLENTRLEQKTVFHVQERRLRGEDE